MEYCMGLPQQIRIVQSLEIGAGPQSVFCAFAFKETWRVAYTGLKIRRESMVAMG